MQEPLLQDQELNDHVRALLRQLASSKAETPEFKAQFDRFSNIILNQWEKLDGAD